MTRGRVFNALASSVATNQSSQAVYGSSEAVSDSFRNRYILRIIEASEVPHSAIYNSYIYGLFRKTVVLILVF